MPGVWANTSGAKDRFLELKVGEYSVSFPGRVDTPSRRILATLDSSRDSMLPRREGAKLVITIDLTHEMKTISFQNQEGSVRKFEFSYSGRLHLAIDSDENNHFSICSGVHI